MRGLALALRVSYYQLLSAADAGVGQAWMQCLALALRVSYYPLRSAADAGVGQAWMQCLALALRALKASAAPAGPLVDAQQAERGARRAAGGEGDASPGAAGRGPLDMAGQGAAGRGDGGGGGGGEELVGQARRDIARWIS
jgi:hypothetical protein